MKINQQYLISLLPRMLLKIIKIKGPFLFQWNLINLKLIKIWLKTVIKIKLNKPLILMNPNLKPSLIRMPLNKSNLFHQKKVVFLYPNLNKDLYLPRIRLNKGHLEKEKEAKLSKKIILWWKNNLRDISKWKWVTFYSNLKVQMIIPMMINSLIRGKSMIQMILFTL